MPKRKKKNLMNGALVLLSFVKWKSRSLQFLSYTSCPHNSSAFLADDVTFTDDRISSQFRMCTWWSGVPQFNFRPSARLLCLKRNLCAHTLLHTLGNILGSNIFTGSVRQLYSIRPQIRRRCRRRIQPF